MTHQFDTHTCPACGSERWGVKDSRPQKVGNATFIRRRRACSSCGHRTSTVEIPAALADIVDLAELMGELE